ncbi:hypothetical protein [Aurantiacibacter odishensis]|uniref:hypothetical protein n=1 Tax=Aurantiacibacter odishensis TaxID=1155476 RepID=UPI000E7349FE|nr:hypothetical protein [Aurantiacibacter odishensis]
MEYTIEIDASRGLLKATGDRDFVESVIGKYDSLMSGKTFAKPDAPQHSSATQARATNMDPEPAPKASANLEEFGSVFDVTEGKVSVIADLPGNTQASKAKSLCLLYLFAKLKLGEEIVPNEEIREACKSHGVYDQTNFATQMKSQKKLVIVSGGKGSPNFTLKLTVPGRKAAQDLAKELEGAS